MPTPEEFDLLMQLNVNDSTVASGSISQKVVKDSYQLLTSHRNLTTYSTQENLHACPRLFQIKKIRASTGNAVRTQTPTFAFGHAVGAGVACYDQTLDLRAAIFQAFLAWDMDLDADERKLGRRNGKSFWEAIWALYCYKSFHADETNLSDYEVVKVEGTVAIDFEDGHFYSGHIDEVLRHKETGRFKVKENKTSGLSNIDTALYSNSDQALSYAVVVDMLGGSEYEVMYTIYSSTEQRWIQYDFVKPVSLKAAWIQDQLLIHSQIESYQELNFFPKRGRSCFNYMRRCEEYGTCDTGCKTVFGKEFSDLPTINSLADIEAIEHIDFPTTLSEIVERQRQKLAGKE